MPYGICDLSVVPLRLEPSDDSLLISQILYGEVFRILDSRKKWSRIKLADDGCEGWIDNKQFQDFPKDLYKSTSKDKINISLNLVDFVKDLSSNELCTIVLGSHLNSLEFLNHSFEGKSTIPNSIKANIVESAFYYLNTPYLQGGKTPFGIDAAGFTQMAYKLNGYKLYRDAAQQSTQGIPLSFIEESEPGDLAFFDDSEGQIIHVGIIMDDNYIIHSDGKVRIDRLDHSGIYNAEKGIHTHKLRVIKKIV